MKNLTQNNFINNSLISFTIRILTFIISFISTFVMARLLSPSNYSEIAFILLIITFFTSITNFGIGNAVLQDNSLNNNEINSLYTSTIIISIFFYFFLVFFAFIYSYTANIPINGFFLLLICFPFMLNFINVIPTSVLYKELKIKNTLLFGFVINLISSIIGILLARFSFGTISLVIPNVFSSFFMFFYNLSQTKLSLNYFSLNALKKIFKYVKFLYPFSIVNYFIRNLDSILIGIFYGNLALAYYSKANHLTILPNDIFAHSITQNLQPSLSKYQNNHSMIQSKYFDFLDFFIPVSLFVGSYSLFTSYEIATLFFGEQWDITAKIFSIISVTIFFQLLTSTIGSIYISADKVKQLLRNSLVALFIFSIFYLIGINFELETFMYFVSSAFILNFFSAFYFLYKDIFKSNFIFFLKKLIPNILFILVIFSISLIFYFFQFDNIIINLVLKSFIFILLFFAYLILSKNLIIIKRFIQLFI